MLQTLLLSAPKSQKSRQGFCKSEGKIMNEDTRLEVIKALAYGEDIHDIANMAEVDVQEVEQIREKYADEIAERREIAGGM